MGASGGMQEIGALAHALSPSMTQVANGTLRACDGIAEAYAPDAASDVRPGPTGCSG